MLYRQLLSVLSLHLFIYPIGISYSQQVIFADVTQAAGIFFKHEVGKTDQKHIVETMGSGLALFDYDNDDDLDLYLVNAGDTPTGQNTVGNVLYRNDGDGTFTDVSQLAGVSDLGYGMAATAADYDNDGDADLYVANFGVDAFYCNNGDGTFSNVTQQAGLGNPEWGVASTFLDYDLDGNLDLFVVNYLAYHTGMPVTRFRGQIGYGHPRAYTGTADRLYQNNGDGTFSDVSLAAGITNAEEGRGMGVVAFDYDNDHWPDLYVTNDTNRNFLYRNNHDGTFTDESLLAGTGYDENGTAEGSMGVDFGDYDCDGWLDLIVANSETATLYRNEHHGFFVETTVDAGLSEPTFRFVGFSPIFLDYDNDTYLDLFSANGHPQDMIELLMDSETYAQVDQLFRNRGDSTFDEVSAIAGDYFRSPYVGRACAGGDYDKDGDLDLFISNSNQPAVLLRNEVGNQQNWLQIRLQGSYSNRDGIGSRVLIESQSGRQTAEVKSGSSYASSSDLRLHFGLGTDTVVDRIQIHWSRGAVQERFRVQANQMVVILEPPSSSSKKR